jgi:hypothetical protein
LAALSTLLWAGDWNGDGCTGVAVFRSGTVLMKNALAAGPADLQFDYGIANDRPLAGVWTEGTGEGSTQPASLAQLRTASLRNQTQAETAPEFSP